MGELALLTGEPRSAGVRARRDATLLEVPRDAFDALLGRDPRGARTVLTQVAGQLRTAGGGATERATRPAPRSSPSSACTRAAAARTWPAT